MNTTTANAASDLLSTQWASYSNAHRDRTNLLVHALTQPLFVAGVCMVPAAVVNGWLLPAGIAAMLVAVAAQGKTHAREPQAPAPFHGARDVLTRLFAEQLVTFPRYVLSGEFARAWRRQAR